MRLLIQKKSMEKQWFHCPQVIYTNMVRPMHPTLNSLELFAIEAAQFLIFGSKNILNRAQNNFHFLWKHYLEISSH